MNSSISSRYHRHLIAFLALGVLITLIYSNTFNAAWHLDDHPNITNNSAIHLENLFPETIKNTFYAGSDGGRYQGRTLYRPFVMLSFALNWYWGQEDTTGYHLVNIGIHIGAAFFLYLTVLNLLNTPNIKNKYKTTRYDIALLSAVLWAVHPIQTQAVTYIVQRMASAGAMFFIAGVYLYIKARLSGIWVNRSVFILGCFFSFILALASKENTAIFPLVLFVLEFLFFQDLTRTQVRKNGMILFCFILIFILIFSTALFLDNEVFGFLKGYEQRPYTVFQRFMTEARVIIFYLYQMIYPVPHNYSLVHDIEVSRSIFSPWTTLASILIIFFLILVGFWQRKKRPLLCFGVFFFFVGHVIESSVIPLELVFEHRNYLPTMFFFVPVSSGIFYLVDKYKKRGKMFFGMIAVTIVIVISSIGLGTYTRNFVWATEETLWKDIMEKAPDSARSYIGFAGNYLVRIGQYDTAIEFFKKALDLRNDQAAYSHMVSYDNIRSILMAKGEYLQAVEYGKKAVLTYPKSNNSRYNYVRALFAANMLEVSLSELDIVIKNEPDLIEPYITKSRLLLKLGRIDQAEAFVFKTMEKDPFNKRAIKVFGFYHFAKKNHGAADYYLNKAINMATVSDKIHLYFVLIENSMEAGWDVKARTYLGKILNDFPLYMITERLKMIKKEQYPEITLSHAKLSNGISAEIQKMAEDFKSVISD